MTKPEITFIFFVVFINRELTFVVLLCAGASGERLPLKA